MLNKLPKPFLIVYDDLMGEIDAKKLADLYTKKSHHNNFAVIFLTQNLFDKAMRVPRSNAQYIFLMRAPNDMLSIRNLATQIFPREQGFLIDAYKQACAEPYGGLVAARENREDDVTEQTNFGFVKQQLEKAKRKRAANVSEKSAMYNQQLRRYLKLRKEVKDKPVKVQLSNGLRLMTKPPATGVQLKPGPEELEETIVIGGSEAGDDEPAAINVQADLADFQALSRKNSGNRYLLLAVDVLSRRMFGVPVKSKKPADMKKAFEELFRQMPKLPETLYTDRGLEFVAKPLKEFYAEKGIKKFETSSKKKAAVAERAIRYMPNYSDHVYTVDERRSSNPEHYYVKDYYGTKLKRKFYLPELTKVKVDKNTLYRVEKKFKERMRDGQKEMLVKFIGFPEKYWVTNEDFEK
uniref:Integrase catalytic domain-containing protein n=1 Tax=Globodera pallida TaxID=36090 RepID=A0A183BY71_GLOPA